MDEQYIIYSQRYQHLKKDGIVVNDIDGGIKRYLKYFGTGMTYEQLRKNYEEKNLDTLFFDICCQFEKLHGAKMSAIELINRYQKGICVSAYTSKIHPAVYVDELFESTIMSFVLTCFLWSEFETDPEIWGFGFTNMLYIFHSQCILGEMMGEEDLNNLLKLVAQKDSHLLDLAADCYWTILTFCLAHELAHIYYRKIGRNSNTNKQCRREEFDADRLAYDLVLHMIMEDSKKPETERTLYEHSCLAPMMLMEYFDLYYYTDRILYKQWVNDLIHPKPIKRKNQLFGILYQPEYNLDTSEAYALYHAVLDVTDKGYKDNLLLKMERGKLQKIINYERRAGFFRQNERER